MIQRYELEQTGHYDDEIDHEMFPNESGEWVRYEDVQPFLSEADQRDAARYRWLRLNQMASIYKAVVVIAGDGAALSILANGTDLDFAIDNAMSKPRVEVPNSHRHNNGRG